MATHFEDVRLGSPNPNNNDDYLCSVLCCFYWNYAFAAPDELVFLSLSVEAMVRGSPMCGTNQNNIPIQQSGKIEESVEIFRTLSGQAVELKHYEMAIMDNGILRKRYCREVVPPLSDGRIPETIADIRECSSCFGLYHFENVLTCPECGRYYCHTCKGKIETLEGDEVEDIDVCKMCEDEKNNSFSKLFKKLWEMGD